jgi:hypothetical protein
MTERYSAVCSQKSCEQRSRKCSKQHCQIALGEEVTLGNELGASLGTCSLSTVSNSLGKDQGYQLSDHVHDDTRAELGEPLGAELGPVLVRTLEAALPNSTRRSAITRQLACCFTGHLLTINCQQQPRKCERGAAERSCSRRYWSRTRRTTQRRAGTSTGAKAQSNTDKQNSAKRLISATNAIQFAPILEPNSAIHSAQSWDQCSCSCSCE